MLNFVIADVHGTGNELERLIEPVHETHNLFSVGDLFDRAPDGLKVWELIHKYKIRAVMGNHEAKMLDFLTGKREWLSSNYYSFLNKFAAAHDLNDLVEYLESLPLIIKLNSKCLIAHAAVNLEHPFREDKGINCFGKYKDNKELSENRSVWQNYYKKDTLVLYGHVTYPKPNYGFSSSGAVNSIGLDTSACHGNKLTGYSVEQNKIYSAKSKEDYFAITKKQKENPSKVVMDFIKNYK